MDWREISSHTGNEWLESMQQLTLEAVAPWVRAKGLAVDCKAWNVASFVMRDGLILITLVENGSARQYTSLICCTEEPEVVAVSFNDGRLGILNPFLEACGPVEEGLDSVACWQVFSLVFAGEPGADRLRYRRHGEVREVQVNEAGYFEIRDWHCVRPVDEYLAVRVQGKWQPTVAGALPYSCEFTRRCWRELSALQAGCTHSRHGWLVSACNELGGSDLTRLNQALAC